jgi:hypothetical protein
MKKIKKFKINFRLREITRLLKATTRVEITPQLEEAVQRESARLHGLASPAAVYETQPREKIPGELAVGAPEKWIAASTYIITVGEAVEHEIRDAQGRGEEMLAQILHAVALEALEQSDNFVRRLLNEEARNENCELSGERRIESSAAWTHFSSILSGDKIGVRFAGTECFEPMYSSAGLIYWLPVKKKK